MKKTQKRRLYQILFINSQESLSINRAFKRDEVSAIIVATFHKSFQNSFNVYASNQGTQQ
jgi:hypothetical protein